MNNEPENPSPDELRADIEEVFDLLGRRLTPSEFKFLSEYPFEAYLEEFENFAAILEEGGYPPETTNSDLIEDVQRVGRELAEEEGLDVDARPPTSLEYDDHGEYSYSMCRRRFGGWGRTLELAGFEATDAHLTHPSEEELLDDLRRLDDEFDERPTMRIVTQHGKYPLSTYQTVFGKFSDALREIGYDLKGERSRDELLSEVREIDEQVDGVLRTHHLEEYGESSVPTYLRKLGRMSEIRSMLGYVSEPETTNENEFTRDEVLDEITSVIEKYGEDVSTSVFEEESDRMTISPVYSKFDSWSDAKEKAMKER